jgi:preprotein translocase subunit SecE
MARNRQRAKQRQAERRARRLADQGEPSAAPAAEPATDGEPQLAPGIDPNLAVGAPPQDEGHSEALVEDEPVSDEEYEEEYADEEPFEHEDVEPVDEEETAYAPRGRRGATDAEAKDRSRFVQFLFASWAELQRVQWPNRQALTTLTGVVLGFVLIAGGYLGLLDAIFSRIINAII